MKKIAMFLAVVILPLLAGQAIAQTITLTKVDLITSARGTKVIQIKEGEAAVGGTLVKRIVLGKTTATISYFNKSRSALKPNYHFRLINAYGIEVAYFDAKWAFTTIALDEASAEEKTILPRDVDKILQFTTIALPEDWVTPIYLIVEGEKP